LKSPLASYRKDIDKVRIELLDEGIFPWVIIPIVHSLLIGTVFVTLINSMTMPFFAIFLLNNTKLDYASIGLIIGAGPLAAKLSGFIGGFLSDMIGRKQLMIISLMLLALTYLGIVMTTNPLLLTFLNIIGGISSSFYGIISKALMGDLTPDQKRVRVFSNRYLAANIGYSVGPVIGAYIGIGGDTGTFLLAGTVYLSYAV
jgi:MFS family permease